jgi:glycosyltransferase involved in cell wall biosynthesis
MQEKVTEKIKKPFVSIILPCYNEEAILQTNLNTIVSYMREKSYNYKWEILIINDGSKDSTGEIAEEFAKLNDNIRVIHHPTNLNLGNALKTGFYNAKGDILVVLDIDLSYSVDHIERMVDKLIISSADIVVASPYMKGGQVTAVPFLRKIMSKWVNKFMRFAAQEKYYTFTGMVRAYRREFIRTLNLKTKDYEVNPEIMYKAMILRARIVEIPANLDWTEQNKFSGQRTSSIRVIRGFFSGIMSGFIFRPYVFFMGIGMIIMCLSLYELIWLFYDTLKGMYQIQNLPSGFDNAFSYSLTMQFKLNPQTFMVGGISLLVALQFLGLGFISLQNKRYFEETFHLGTSLKKQLSKDIEE